MKANLVVALVLATTAAVARAGERDFATVEQEFSELPMKARHLTGPLFWLHGDDSRGQLEGELQRVVEGGNGCFTLESRPHGDWLGEGWWRDLGICLDFARKHDLQMWLYDDKHFPSGVVDGRIPPAYGGKTMQADATIIDGPKQFAEPGYGTNLIAVLAGRQVDGGLDGQSLVDLGDRVKDGTLTWAVPAGQWKVMKFTWAATGGRVMVDGASRESVDWYLKTVHQPHYEHFKKDFGPTIQGFFYDEPNTPGDWGTEVIPLLKERQVDWKKALVAWKFSLAGEDQIPARYQYQDAFAEAWGRTLYGGMSRWCREHKVRSLGHFCEDDWSYLNPKYCAGNMFQLQKYSDISGIDLVCKYYYPGQKDMKFWQVARLASSNSHVYNKGDDLTMCEMFGDYGQQITYSQMKWFTDEQQLRGVNFVIPHSFNPRAPYDDDCPPYYDNGGFEPRWPLYRVFADYATRMNLMLSGGRHVAPVAFLFLGNSSHVGKTIPPEELTTRLEESLYDCDWMPYEVFEKDASLAGKDVRLHQERYQALIVPPVEVIPYETLVKAREFFDQGGVVVGYGFLPTRSATLGKTSADITALRTAIWGAAPETGTVACRQSKKGGQSYLLPEKPSVAEITQALARDANIPPLLELLEGDTGNWLQVLHRQKEGRDLFLVCNLNLEGAARKFRFRTQMAGVPECWDAMRNEISAIPFQRQGPQVEFSLTLEASESVLLVFQKEHRQLPPRLSESARKPSMTIAVTADPNATPVTDPEIPARPGPVTRSPVRSNIFQGCCQIPSSVDLATARIYLEVDELAPEPAASIRVNGQYAGGFIGRPFRLEVTKHFKPGVNSIGIAPFAPKTARLIVQ